MPLHHALVGLSPDLVDDPDIFPLLRGCEFPAKAIIWSTTVNKTKTGRRFGTKNYSYPITRFNASFASLSEAPDRQDKLRLAAFFNRRAGQYGPFYYYDPTDNLVLGQPIGTGDGVTTQFKLLRSFGDWQEPVYALHGPPTVTVAGTEVFNFAIIAPGIIEFTAAPALGAVVAWTGTFFFWCYFNQDDFSAQQLNDHLWSSDGLEFETLKP